MLPNCAVCAAQALLLLDADEGLARERLRQQAQQGAAALACLCHSNALLIHRRDTGREGREDAGVWVLRELAPHGTRREAVEFVDDDGDAVRLRSDAGGAVSLVINGAVRGRPRRARWNPARRALHFPPWRSAVGKLADEELPPLLAALAGLLDRAGVPHDIPGGGGVDPFAVAHPRRPPAGSGGDADWQSAAEEGWREAAALRDALGRAEVERDAAAGRLKGLKAAHAEELGGYREELAALYAALQTYERRDLELAGAAESSPAPADAEDWMRGCFWRVRDRGAPQEERCPACGRPRVLRSRSPPHSEGQPAARGPSARQLLAARRDDAGRYGYGPECRQPLSPAGGRSVQRADE
eukprot:TRINITY_DN1822_c1_g1_i2.p1 TRINITY_DN1822_c1_g1~~TRINITY_DN1822_c1_g1_i2.p1  ORF type:complete len:375 (+),score=113.46 TRINITY_DN1822_c1_g1_i2:60-1127(+)